MILVASIHDVAPPNLPAVRRLWGLCRDAKLTPSLLVVPDWHGGAPIEQDPEFLTWLRGAVAAGAEVVLHGERHDEVGRPRSLTDNLRAMGRTAREGECLTLDAPELEAMVARGLARLRRAGFEAQGFIPPAWLMRADAVAGAFAAGARFTEDASGVMLPGGKRLPSPVLRWSARTWLRARGSLLVASTRRRWQSHAPLMRVALHPGDLADQRVAASLPGTLRAWSAGRQARAYASLA